MEGYLKNGKEVDLNWWIQQIRVGEEDRDLKANQNHWKTWQKMYRDEWDLGTFPKNMMFIMKRSIVPKIYFRNPKISIVAKKPGIAHQSLAKVMERTDNMLINSMGLKREMKRMVDSTFVRSSGVLKLLFGAEHTPSPALGSTEAPITKHGQRPEYRQGIVPNMPFAKAIDLDDFVLAQDVQYFDDSFFQAHRIVRYWDDLENDSRFPDFKKFAKKGVRSKPINQKDSMMLDGSNTRDLVELYEVRDRRTKKVFLFAPHYMKGNKTLYFGDDELQTSYSSPFFFYTPNPDDEHPYGISDARVLSTYQEQLNEINTKIYIHAKLSIVKLISEKNAISPEQANNLMNEDIGIVVQVAKASGVVWAEAINDIPDGLVREKMDLLEDIREVMGFSRNSMAQFQAKSHGPTATEVNIVRNAAELRTDERRDMLSDILTDLFRDIHLIIYRHWDQEQVVKVVGEDGLPVWVKFTGEMLQEGEYELRIEPDTTVAETTEVREARAEKIYADMTGNPTIDPVKLTRYYLHEHSGVALDDLMVAGVSPQEGILSLDEFTQQEQNTVANNNFTSGGQPNLRVV